MVYGCKTNGVALKDSDMILCFVHPALLFWKVRLFTEEADVLSLGNAIINRLLLTIVKSWALADVREQEMRGWLSQQKTQGTEEVKCDDEKSCKLMCTLCVKSRVEQMLTN